MENKLWGVYSPEDELLAVHSTEDGAELNFGRYLRQHGEGFYVDIVVVHD